MRFARSNSWRCLLLALLAAPYCLAQQPQAPEPAPDGGASGMTLHVTVKELQVAALVLDLHRRPVLNVDKSRFRLQVDTDKPFSPTTIHHEGDDPISLAVVIDASHERWFHASLGDALANLREHLLLPHDRLLLFAVDCSLITSRGDTSTGKGVKEAVQALLTNPRLHYEGKPGRTCEDHLRLWDSSLLVLRKLAPAPGRHALLLLSDGADSGSTTKMLELARYNTITATTIFALPATDLMRTNGPKSMLEQLAIRTGGQMLDPPGRNDINRPFADCIALLRGRYILGFNQPQHAKPGEHIIQTLVQKSGYIVRTSGVSVPLQDKEGNTMTEGQDASTDTPQKP